MLELQRSSNTIELYKYWTECEGQDTWTHQLFLRFFQQTEADPRFFHLLDLLYCKNTTGWGHGWVFVRGFFRPLGEVCLSLKTHGRLTPRISLSPVFPTSATPPTASLALRAPRGRGGSLRQRQQRVDRGEERGGGRPSAAERFERARRGGG